MGKLQNICLNPLISHCPRVRVCAYVYVRTHACVYVCTYVHIHVCIHVYTYLMALQTQKAIGLSNKAKGNAVAVGLQ